MLTIAALLLIISAFSTKPNLDVMSSGSMGASVAPCMTVLWDFKVDSWQHRHLCSCRAAHRRHQETPERPQRSPRLAGRTSLSHESLIMSGTPAKTGYWENSAVQQHAEEGTHLGKLWDWKGWQVLYSISHGPSLLQCSVAGALMQASGDRRSSEGPVTAVINQEPSDVSSTMIPKTTSEHIWGTAAISLHDAKVWRV